MVRHSRFLEFQRETFSFKALHRELVKSHLCHLFFGWPFFSHYPRFMTIVENKKQPPIWKLCGFCKDTIYIVRTPYTLQRHHIHCKDTIYIARTPYTLQGHHIHCKDTIYIAKTPYTLQRHHIHCKDTIYILFTSFFGKIRNVLHFILKRRPYCSWTCIKRIASGLV